ncbi:MAG: RNA polymerase sigma factor [Actinobacteria bacterium]|nr:RNA polymerase sigma factor [Actinomycetota bacterium]
MADIRIDPRTDEELMGALCDGDRSALQTLHERHAPWLLIRLSRRCADPGIVDEVVQDTFLAVWRRPNGYRGTGNVGAWIWGIGVRRLIDHLRRQKAPAAQLTDFTGDASPSAEEQVLLGVEHGDLAGALNRMSPELRAVVQATVLDGLTTREASRLLGVPAGTVKTRMMRAKPYLREALL